MKRSRTRVGIGLLVAAAVWLLLDRLIPFEATTLAVALARMALFALIASAVGGFIAIHNFVIPAIVLAALTWIAILGYSMYLGWSVGNPLWDYVVWNLPSTVLIPAVAIGAKIGTVAATKHARSSTA